MKKLIPNVTPKKHLKLKPKVFNYNTLNERRSCPHVNFHFLPFSHLVSSIRQVRMPKLTSIQSGGVYIRSSTTLTGATVNWCQLFENNQYKKQKYLTDKLKYKHQIANLYEEREVNIYGNKIVCGVNETQAFKKLQNDHHTDQICKICPEITYPPE